MSRPGKREREARNRHKRCKVSFTLHTPTGPAWITVKRGRKKHWLKLEERLRTLPVADVRELRRARAL